MRGHAVTASCAARDPFTSDRCSRWPELESALVRPGSVVRGPGGPVYASFLWHDASHDRLLLSVPAICMEGAAPGAEVSIEGATRPGRLAFRAGGIAFIAIHEEDRARSHPAVMGVGGPSRLSGTDLAGQAVTAFTAAGHVTHCQGSDLVVDLHLPDTFIAPLAGDAVVAEDGEAVGMLLDPPGHGPSAGLLLRPAVERIRRLGFALHLVTAEGF